MVREIQRYFFALYCFFHDAFFSTHTPELEVATRPECIRYALCLVYRVVHQYASIYDQRSPT